MVHVSEYFGRANQLSGWLAAIVLLLSLSSCSSFQREWQAAEQHQGKAGIEGRWDGTWRSKSTGHSGQLRCIVTPTEVPNVYRFHYGGSFAKALRFDYVVEYTVRQKDSGWSMTGESNLGLMGGVFTHTGSISGGVFRARYFSSRDNGSFEMRRPFVQQMPATGR